MKKKSLMKELKKRKGLIKNIINYL